MGRGENLILNFDSELPIYLQLAEAIEDDILKGIIAEDGQVPSTTEISIAARINPATARKGINLLVDEGIIYKKRGVGMFVSVGARERIKTKRRDQFFEKFVETMLDEARKLKITKEELVAMIRGGADRA